MYHQFDIHEKMPHEVSQAYYEMRRQEREEDPADSFIREYVSVQVSEMLQKRTSFTDPTPKLSDSLR